MKAGLAISFCCIIWGVSQGQVVPNTITTPAGAIIVNQIPAGYDAFMKVNFVRSWETLRPFISQADVIDTIRTAAEGKQVTQYFDGLGRSLQTVSKRASPSGKDLVAPKVYDVFGRETYRYLPYIAIDSQSTSGKFRRNAFNEQASFFRNTTFNPGLIGEQVYYRKEVFEKSPLYRIDTSFSPGNSWGGSSVGIVKGDLINTAADSVRIWNVAFSMGSTPSSIGYYAPGALYKTVTKNEHGKQTIEYKDKEGKIILNKVQLDASPSSHHLGWICTYYVYDDLSKLRVIVQPKGVELRTGDWQLSSEVLDELCFRYEYDARSRLIIKKIPGTGEVFMVYDARDRLVMKQDSVLRLQGKWLFMLYDGLNRPTVTGLWTNSNTRSYHETQAIASITYPNPGSNFEVLTETYYDNYAWASGVGLNSSFINTYTSNTNYFYTPSNTFPFPQAITPTNITSGMLTGTKTKVLGTSTYLYTIHFYDDHGRVIQTHGTNYSGGKDTLTIQYSFSGQMLRSLLCHEKSSPSAKRYQVLTKNEYDAGGRIVRISKKIGNSPETIITENSYDELGQLRKKLLGQKRNASIQNTYTTDPLDSLNYVYNIRGWLRGINKDYARATTTTSWFGMELTYDFGFSQTQVDGNIAGTRWRSKGDGEQRAYGYTYDATGRFMKADFNQYTSGSWNKDAGIDFTVKGMGYDPNGNILSLTQKGLKLTGSSTIDSLNYVYLSGANKLTYVTDRTNEADSRLGDFKEQVNNTSQDYWYDGNGNLSADNNKGINSIVYNHLNLPSEIKVNGKGKVSYTYDANGNKLSKSTIDSTNSPIKTTSTSYLGLFTYQNDTLQFIETEEGRVRPKSAGNSDTMYYDYFEKDHIGNIRVILTDELRTDMYPAATMEVANDEIESIYYSNIDNNRNIRPEPFDVDVSYSSPNDEACMVMGNNHPIGTGILLKVMAGDKFNIRASSYYDGSIPLSPTNTNITTPLINALSSHIEIQSAGKILATDLQSFGSFLSIVTDFLNDQTGAPSAPKAYLNWIAFDEQFKYDSSSSGFIVAQQNEILSQSNLPINRNGYLYVFVSNTTNDVSVFFDNLQVSHIRGPLLEENHYYPFGLTQAGISSKASNFGGGESMKKFQGQELAHKEFSDGSGLEMYEFRWRMADPQTGRFWQIDPLAEKYEYNSTYAFSENKVINHIELEGLEAVWADNNVERDIRDISSGRISKADLEKRVAVRAGASKAFTIAAAIGGTIAAGIMIPGFANAASLVMAAEIFGAPSPGAPSSVATTVIAETKTVVSLETRAKEIHSTLSTATQNRTTTAVASATTAEGNTITLVASSEKNLRPAQRAALQPGEIAVSGIGHAEATIINHAAASGMKVSQIAASRPICTDCATSISGAGAAAVSELKRAAGALQ